VQERSWRNDVHAREILVQPKRCSKYADGGTRIDDGSWLDRQQTLDRTCRTAERAKWNKVDSRRADSQPDKLTEDIAIGNEPIAFRK
jgi:hypothetical protein